MKAFILSLALLAAAQTSLAETGTEKETSPRCNDAALASVNAKKDILQKEVEENEAEPLQLLFLHMTVKNDIVNPMPVEIHGSGALDDRHLIYALGVKAKNGELSYGGYLLVQCQQKDLSKVDDLNKDGRIDAEDVVWVLD